METTTSSRHLSKREDRQQSQQCRDLQDLRKTVETMQRTLRRDEQRHVEEARVQQEHDRRVMTQHRDDVRELHQTIRDVQQQREAHELQLQQLQQSFTSFKSTVLQQQEDHTTTLRLLQDRCTAVQQTVQQQCNTVQQAAEARSAYIIHGMQAIAHDVQNSATTYDERFNALVESIHATTEKQRDDVRSVASAVSDHVQFMQETIRSVKFKQLTVEAALRGSSDQPWGGDRAAWKQHYHECIDAVPTLATESRAIKRWICGRTEDQLRRLVGSTSADIVTPTTTAATEGALPPLPPPSPSPSPREGDQSTSATSAPAAAAAAAAAAFPGSAPSATTPPLQSHLNQRDPPRDPRMRPNK